MLSKIQKRKVNPMSTTEPVVESKEVTIKKTYEYFDENLVMQSKEVEVKFTPAVTYEEGVARLNSDAGRILEGINIVLRKSALSEARGAAGVSGGINRAVLMDFIKPYRELPQFASMITATDKRKATAEEWNKQTSAILEQIKNVPFIMTSIRELSTKVNETED